MQNLVDKLIDKKAETGATNAWIAEKSGIPESTVTKVMNGTNRSPQMDTIIPIAEALGVPLSSKTSQPAEDDDPIAEEEVKACKNITILEQAHERECAEKDRRIADKDMQIKHMWWVIIVLAILFLSCVAGFVILYIYDHTNLDRGWITQAVDYARQYTGKAMAFAKDVLTM